MPQYVNGKLYDMHGEGSVPIGPALPFKGGIFGQPKLPQPRSGIFESNWALPWGEQIDNTIGPGHNMLSDRYMRASGWPVIGLGCDGCGDDGTGIVASSSGYLMSALIGAGAGLMLAAPSKKGSTSLFGAILGLAGNMVATTSAPIIGGVLGGLLAARLAK